MDNEHVQATPGVATAVVVTGKNASHLVAAGNANGNAGAAHGRWILKGRRASVGGAMAWPTGLPLLHPGQTHRLLSEQLKKRTIKNFVHSYGECFTGEDVIQCLVKDRNNQEVRTHAAVVLDFLNNVGVLIPIGHAKKLKTWHQRLYRVTDIHAASQNYGAVFVHVEKANGLIAENMSGTSNALAEVRLGDAKICTHVIRRDLNPVWNACFVFFVRFECSTRQQRHRAALATRASESSQADSGLDFSLSSMGDVLDRMDSFENLPAGLSKEPSNVVVVNTKVPDGSSSQQPSPSHASKRTELGISVHVYASRSARGRTGIGRSSVILVRSVRPQKKTVNEIAAVQQLTFSLLRTKPKDTNVLLAARTGFKQGKNPLDAVEDGVARSAKAAKRNADKAHARNVNGSELSELPDFGGDFDDDEDEDDGDDGDEDEETSSLADKAARRGLAALGVSGDFSSGDLHENSNDSDVGFSSFNEDNNESDSSDGDLGFLQIGQKIARKTSRAKSEGNLNDGARIAGKAGKPETRGAKEQYTNSKLGQLELRLAWVQLIPETPAAAGNKPAALEAGSLKPPNAAVIATAAAPETTGKVIKPPIISQKPASTASPPSVIRTTTSHVELSDISLPASIGAPESSEAAVAAAGQDGQGGNSNTTPASPSPRVKPGHSSLPRPRLFRRESSRPVDDVSQSAPALDQDRPHAMRRQTSKLNRILGKKPKKTPTPPVKSVVLGSKADQCEVSEMARSRKVQYLEQRRRATACHAERRAAIKSALEQYKANIRAGKQPAQNANEEKRKSIGKETANEASSAATARPAKEFAEDAEVEAAVKCFVFDFPEKAFQLLADDDQQIVRAMWLTLAPFLPPLCHTLNAHEVFDALVLAQFGNKLNRTMAMSSQVRALHYPVFELYVRSLKASAISTERARRKAILDFPALQQYFFEGERVVCIMDKVRGGRTQETAYRRSQYGGRLIVTTRAVYFAKKHTFSSNELVREDLWHALQVLESNGSVDFGLMIGFANKTESSKPTAPGGEAPVPSLLPGSPPTPSPSETDLNQDIRADLAGIDELFSRLAADGSLDDEDEDEDPDGDNTRGIQRTTSSLGTTAGGRPLSTSSASATMAAAATATTASPHPKGRFELVLPRKTIARYVVFRFPSYGTWRKRDVDILKLRALIALRIFSEHVLGPVVEKYVIKAEQAHTEASVAPSSSSVPAAKTAASAAAAGAASTSEKELLLAASREAAEAVALADLQSFKALVRMSEKRDWDWLSGVDTFEAFGDKWSWKRWCPLAFINLVCSAVQPNSRRSETLRARANESLFVLAVQLIKEAAATQLLTITWARSLRRDMQRPSSERTISTGPVASKSDNASTSAPSPGQGTDETTQTKDSETTSLLPCLDEGGAASFSGETPKATFDDGPEAVYKPELATSRSSVTSQSDASSATGTGSLALESSESTRTSTVLLESVDKWWLEHTKLLQSDMVRSATRLKSLGQNIDLLVNVLMPIKQIADECKEIFHAIITWESPRFTVGLGLVSLVLILLGYTAYFCGILVGAMAMYLMHMRHVRDDQGFRKLYVPAKKKRTLLEKYRGIKEKYQVAKKVLQRVNLNLLRARSILTWENEKTSSHVALWLVGIALFLTFTPRVVYELAIWVYIFTKKFRSGKMRRRIVAYMDALWNEVPPAPLWEKVDQHQAQHQS